MAERDFDIEFDYEKAEGHTFTLGGYSFRTFPVAPPGAFLSAGRGLLAACKFLRRVVIPEDRADLERVLEMTDTSSRLLDLAPDLLLASSALIDAEDGPEKARTVALDKLRDVVDQVNEADGKEAVMVSAVQVDTVAEWLMEVTLGRPTIPPSPSGNGGGATSNGSKATSPKRAKAGKT